MRALRYAQRFSTRLLYLLPISFPVAQIARALRTEKTQERPFYFATLSLGLLLSTSCTALPLSLTLHLPLSICLSLYLSLCLPRSGYLALCLPLHHSSVRNFASIAQHTSRTASRAIRSSFFTTATTTCRCLLVAYLLCELASPFSRVYSLHRMHHHPLAQLYCA